MCLVFLKIDNNVKSKLWFNKECKTKRDAFHEVKNRYSVDKSDEIKTLLKKRSKEYKKELNLNYKKHQEKCANELDSLSKSNPKSFWNTLNKFSTNSRKTHYIPIDTLYDYFKTINANTNLDTDDEIDGIDKHELYENNLYDNILNGVISESEISETITKLKNNKAPGADGILNEYFKKILPFVNPNIFQII